VSARTPVTGAVLAALLLAGCGLPLERGVQTPVEKGRLTGAEQAGTTAYLPPGPSAGAPPIGVVSGFLRAQASADGDHAIARRFLSPEARETWNDDAQVKVYDPEQLDFTLLGNADGDVVQVRMQAAVTAMIAADGSLDPEDGVLDETYGLRRDAEGNWVLTSVPDGLRLRPSDVDRSYATELIYYLAAGGGPNGHLVPEPALLLVADEPAEGLVRRLVAGPSSALVGAVDSAVPVGAEVVAVTTDAAGVVTVDLGARIAELRADQLERLSAQLVWTLREGGSAFSGLRLLSAGRPVEVPGIDGQVQERSAWTEYDPDGLPEQVTTYYVADRELRTLESEQPVRASAGFAVDRAAVSPRTAELAILTDIGEGRSEVRIGPLTGRLPAEPTYTGGGLRAPSWGAGHRGLWMLQTGSGPQIVLLQRSGEVLPVPVVNPPPGRITDMRVSRDGARIALVAGEDDASRRVYVASILDDEGGLRIGPPREVGFGVTDVSDVAWESATSLVALGEFSDLEPLPLRLAIDGSGAVDLVRLPGLEDLTRESLAWGPDRPLIVAATRQGRPVLLRSAGGVLVELSQPGYAPFYPG
jgi:hypothetical protein